MCIPSMCYFKLYFLYNQTEAMHLQMKIELRYYLCVCYVVRGPFLRGCRCEFLEYIVYTAEECCGSCRMMILTFFILCQTKFSVCVWLKVILYINMTFDAIFKSFLQLNI